VNETRDLRNMRGLPVRGGAPAAIWGLKGGGGSLFQDQWTSVSASMFVPQDIFGQFYPSTSVGCCKRLCFDVTLLLFFFVIVNITFIMSSPTGVTCIYYVHPVFIILASFTEN